MDSAQLLAKLSISIQAISSQAEKASVNVENCQTLAAAIQNLVPLIHHIQSLENPVIDDMATLFDRLESVANRAKNLIVRYGRETSKLYAVLRKEKFSHSFKVHALEIANDIASLPLGAVNLNEDVKKQVENCICDLREAAFDTDREDDLYLNIKTVLKDVKDAVKLSHDKLRDVATSFSLNTNQDILREAALLQRERDMIRVEKGKQEEETINQLLVLVTKMEDVVQQKQAQVEFAGIPVPADFRCPLSLQLMSDPVIVASGQTYERACIQQWLDQGNMTCPKTRQTLSHKNLIPNYTVKALIANWCEANGVPFPESTKSNCLSVTEGCTAHKASGRSEACENFSSSTNSNHVGYTRGDENDAVDSLSRNTSSSSIASSADDTLFSAVFNDNSTELRRHPNAMSSSDRTRETQRRPTLSASRILGSAAVNRLSFSASSRERGHTPSRAFSQLEVTENSESEAQANILQLVEDLQSDSIDVQRTAATSLRLLAKQSAENRILIANCGAISPLIASLDSEDQQTQENAVTALLNLSINDQNKNEIAAAGAIHPLVRVLETGTPEAKENSAATLFSLSVMDENKVTVGQSGAIPLLVDLLTHGKPRGKKDAATALYNLSLLPENKSRIVSAGAVRPLVQLMSDPAAGLVDKALQVLANLATIPEGKNAIGDEGGIPALVEVVEMGSQRGKENAAATLLHLCSHNHRFRAMVLQEGAIPPLVALSQSGTARAKEKASAILRQVREQRQSVLGRGMRERHVDQSLSVHRYV